MSNAIGIDCTYSSGVLVGIALLITTTCLGRLLRSEEIFTHFFLTNFRRERNVKSELKT